MIAAQFDLGPYIKRSVAGGDLNAAEAYNFTQAIAEGAATPAQTAALLVGLAVKGECASELLGAASLLRELMNPFEFKRRPVMDVCGTGGDGFGSFNVSTAVAFVVAGAGVAVAKHGNRAMSGACGSADVAEALGIRVDAQPTVSINQLEQDGVAFLFAQAYHPVLRGIAAVRREIAVRTLFNLVGPLVNPARPERQLVGVSQQRALRPLVEALAALGSQRCAAVRGVDGMDEVSLSGPTQVVEWTGSDIVEYMLEPSVFGVPIAPASSIRGGDARENAAIIRAVLDGRHGAARDIVAINAALALYIGGAAEGLREGLCRAQAAINSGAARAKLDALVMGTQR